MNTFRLPTTVCFDQNALDKLCEYKNVNAVIFTDPFMVKSGVAQRIAEKLDGCNSVSIFGDVKPDPPIELVVQGLDFLLKANADIVVALGGGSSIDAAKAVLLMAKRSGKKQDIKLVAIPTTSGTGSEVTMFSVITDREAGVKYPLVHEDLQPDVAILDPELVRTAPASITADTGFDVITHALEAYISTAANDFSDALAEKALELAFEFLPLACKDGNNIEARDKMHKASCLAGMSFNIVSLGVNHGIAHALGAKFHIPHGRANAMLLPHVMRHNADLPAGFSASPDAYTTAAKKLAKIAGRIGIKTTNIKHSVNALCDHILALEHTCGIPATLAEAKVSKEDYLSQKSAIIKSALNDACTATNPRKMTSEGVEEILSHIAKY
ncbi:MAG: iron-containing alcohol dehydrogenase [Ruminococcaceae bacterium]|nr:iron-containing alcohol dehydrogenase [Oscillospiraceae bacterium]